jgi:hypothetical protein
VWHFCNLWILCAVQTLEKIKCQLIKCACGNLLMAFWRTHHGTLTYNFRGDHLWLAHVWVVLFLCPTSRCLNCDINEVLVWMLYWIVHWIQLLAALLIWVSFPTTCQYPLSVVWYHLSHFLWPCFLCYRDWNLSVHNEVVWMQNVTGKFFTLLNSWEGCCCRACDGNLPRLKLHQMFYP